jgi:catalase
MGGVSFRIPESLALSVRGEAPARCQERVSSPLVAARKLGISGQTLAARIASPSIHEYRFAVRLRRPRANRVHSGLTSNFYKRKEILNVRIVGIGNVIAQIVEVMRVLARSRPGFRPAHAKGIVCSGEFHGGQDAPSVSRAAHLQGQAVSTIVRFANGSGDSEVHDGLANTRSLTVRFQLPDGQNADILANSVEGFFVRTPEDFLAFLQAQVPNPASGQPAPDAFSRFLGSHPAARAFMERLSQKPVPASYAQASYHADHAFRFTAADGPSRFGRYHWVPEAGESYLSPADANTRSANFLRDDLENRLSRGPVVFRLFLQLAGESDPTDDVTALWPAERTQVELGRLEVTSISATSAADERRLVFDPTNLTDGIDLSADPILLVRSAAYSLSYELRSMGA